MRVSRFILAFCVIGILAGENKNKENKKDTKKKKQLKNSQQGMASDYEILISAQTKIKCPNIETPISDVGKKFYSSSSSNFIQTLEQNISL